MFHLAKNLGSFRRVILNQFRLQSSGVGDKLPRTTSIDPQDAQQNDLITIEPSEVTELPSISGIPKEHIYTRRVRIYKPSKNAMQSGTYNTNRWRLDFENRERWENPLMGWGSTGDPLSNMNVYFFTKEEAAAYCEKNGWYYEIDEPIPRRDLKKSYAENFSWDKRTRVGTK